MIKLYNTWKKVKGVFKKPRLNFMACKWTDSPCLPVWRRGPVLFLVGRKRIGWNGNVEKGDLAYTIVRKWNIKAGYGEWTDAEGKKRKFPRFDKSLLKYPEGIKEGDIVWNSSIRKRLKKLGLGWLKPRYELPIWLSFHVTNLDVMWKTKWGDYRYEFPPTLSIVLFGFSFNWWLTAPVEGPSKNDDYWESILWYLDTKDLKKVKEKMGYWEMIGADKEKIREERLDPNFLEKEWRDSLLTEK